MPGEEYQFNSHGENYNDISQESTIIFDSLEDEATKDIDFIMVYNPNKSTKQHINNREIFEENLREKGLILEKDERDHLSFVKITATQEVLQLYAEITKMRLPMRNNLAGHKLLDRDNLAVVVKKNIKRLLRFMSTDDETDSPHEEEEFKLTAEFTRNRLYLFNVEDPNFFCQAVRISIVAFILERTSFSTNDVLVSDCGIERMLHNKSYLAAYPIHDGCISDTSTKRQELYTKWASFRNIFRYQPIDSIKDYFGIKFALYFAWLGFYTYMLIPASIVGLICFIFGGVTLNFNTYSSDICDQSLNITMCPQCELICDYWKLEDSCAQSRITYLFDNNFTVFFAIFMSFWSAVYLEMWKRYSAEITHRWGLTGFDPDAEHPRTEFLARLNNAEMKQNYVTGQMEPTVPFWRKKMPLVLFSYSVVLFLISLAITAMFGVMVYRMAISRTKLYYGPSENTVNRDIVVPVSAAIINLVVVTILNQIYIKLAVYLTELELLRTKTEFDESVTLKIYLFQFVNYYSSIFYVAFFKGKFIGHPSNYNKIFGIRQEECSPGGCFHEVFIQLAITMVGRKILEYLVELLKYVFFKCLKYFKPCFRKTDNSEDVLLKNNNQWNKDFKLEKWPESGLFEDYLEMVLQYGFVTIFVATFPLAPLCALLANVFELRMDARKFLKIHRRPIPERARNIGIWYNIMDILGRLSTLTNAFIIAATSNFIPRLVYMSVISPNNTDSGFLNYSLAYFDTKDFEYGAPVNSTLGNIEICRYRDYRNPPWNPDGKKYELANIFWYILMARLAFVVAFQNFVTIVQTIVRWAIPDIPQKLNDKIKREAYVTNEVIIIYEAAAMRKRHRKNTTDSSDGVLRE